MNPTDQASKYDDNTIRAMFTVINLLIILGKEARKKELKKNKKQRQMVRQAVLKNKDPAQLLEEMEKIDEMGM
jgi:WW domain binding protein 11